MKSRVLAADASISLLEMIKIAFQDAGFDVFTTSDGKDVLDLAQEIEPDVMLLGISLPEEDGVALGRRLRGLDRFRRIPLFFMAGVLERVNKEKLSGLVFEDLVRTPFDSKAFALRVRHILEENADPHSLPEDPEPPDSEEKGKELREFIIRLVKEEVLEAERELEKRLSARLRSEFYSKPCRNGGGRGPDDNE
jgi:DNA-binding response OmpR family regulator